MAPKSTKKAGSTARAGTPPPSLISSKIAVQSDDAIILTENDFISEQQQPENNNNNDKNEQSPSTTGKIEKAVSKKSKKAAAASSSSPAATFKDDVVDFASFFLGGKFAPKDNNEGEEEKNNGAATATATGEVPTASFTLGQGRQKEDFGFDDASSDSSWEEEPTLNRIGDVPLEWYKDSDHVGYDIDGRRILRPKESALDSLLNATDDPNALRTIVDPTTGEKKILSNHDLQVLFNIQRNRAPNPEYSDEAAKYPVPKVEFDPLNHPLARSTGPSKKTFVPSRADTKKLNKMVRAELKAKLEGKKLKKKKRVKKEQKNTLYNLWDGETELDNKQRFKRRMAIPKTKVAPPGTYESYRPPAEYLPSEKAKLRFRRLRAIDRKEHFLPERYDALRHVPFYNRTIQDRYQRCLDLTQFPRRQRTRLVVDPDKLLPDLPEPSDLRPFPEKLCFMYKGHTSTVRSISISPNGEYLATGCDDHMVRIFETMNGRLVKRYEVGGPVMQLLFCPNPALNILAVAVEYQLLFFIPEFMSVDSVNDHSSRFLRAPMLLTSATNEAEAANELDASAGAANLHGRGITQAVQDADETVAATAARDLDDDAEKQIRADFVEATPTERRAGIVVKVVLHARVRRFDWHNKGDYMSLLCPKDHVKYRQTIMLHISQRKVFCPFRKFSEIVTDCKFHPSEPYFFLSTTNSVRCYNLLAHKLIKRFKSPGGLTTCISIHPEGENFIVGDSTAHTQWFDTEYSEKSYRRLKSHKGVVNEVAFHSNTGAYPLFATGASDGQVHIFHGMVYDDYNKNALIVPVKILKHQRSVYSLVWHPTLPWIFTSTDDGTVCCWCEN